MLVGGSGRFCGTIGKIITKPHGQITYDWSRRVKRMTIFTWIVGSRVAGGVVGTWTNAICLLDGRRLRKVVSHNRHDYTKASWTDYI